jgi:putative redox protein
MRITAARCLAVCVHTEQGQTMPNPPISQRLEFTGHSGATLAARLDLPGGSVRAWALFAHCFTCSKDLLAARRIAAELAREGIAVMRFDFTGLGSSNGEFASTNFSSNVADLLGAAEYLRAHYAAPAILVGHSLGGAAMLAVARSIPEAKAVVTIGAPSDTRSVLKQFGTSIEAIEANGEAEVELSGRKFTIRKQFVDDVRAQTLAESIATMRKALLVMHSPLDEVVGIDHATAIFRAARHPKSFVSLDTADHLLTKAADADYAAKVIAGWAARYVGARVARQAEPVASVRVSETGEGRYQNTVQAGSWRAFADEPENLGGLGSGPSPYDFLAIALGACTSITLRMYAEHKRLALGRIRVDVAHAKVHAKDCAECTEDERAANARIDRFERVISLDGEIPDEVRERLLAIADKCPVHRTLEAGARVVTRIASPD